MGTDWTIVQKQMDLPLWLFHLILDSEKESEEDAGRFISEAANKNP